jgi:hypothetical protein
MSNIRLVPNFAARYPVTPSAEERRTTYIMINGFHMYLPEGAERDAYSAYLQNNPLQPHLGSREAFLLWAEGCVRTCHRDDNDVRARKRREAKATKERNTRQMVALAVLVSLFGIVYGADKL